LDSDASDRAIGAVFTQDQDGAKKVIAYASRLLDCREQNNCVTHRELLAVVFFHKHSKQYLVGRSFVVTTDNAALSWLKRTPYPIGPQARWLEQLEEYTFRIEHQPRIPRGNADEMSRSPCPTKDHVCKEEQKEETTE